MRFSLSAQLILKAAQQEAGGIKMFLSPGLEETNIYIYDDVEALK